MDKVRRNISINCRRIGSCIFFIALLFIAQNAFAQNIPSNRLMDWSFAGLTQEIPNPNTKINFYSAGADNKGLIPNDSLWQAILLQHSGESIEIFFPEGKYLFHQELNLPSNIQLTGMGAELSTLVFDIQQDASLIQIYGSQSNDSMLLEQNALYQSHEIFLKASANINPGDWIKIIDDDSALITSTWARYSTGQILQIDSFVDGKVYLNQALRRSYSMAKSASVFKVNPKENIVISGLSIINQKASNSSTSNIAISFGINCKISCIESRKGNFAHIDIRNASHILVEGSHFKDAFAYGNGGQGYGVVLHQGSGDCQIVNNTFDHLRHAMLLQSGANGNALLYNYSHSTYWTGVLLPSNSAGDLVLHGNYPYLNLMEGNIVQNIVIDDSHGKNGPFNTFFRNRAELFGLLMNNSPASDSLNFIGNECTGTGLFYGNFLIYGNGHYSWANNKKGNILPSGTNNLSITSLFYQQKPQFLQATPWPVIGSPNNLAQYQNAAAIRFGGGYKTACTFTMNLPESPRLQPKLKCYPNPTKDIIHIQSESENIKSFRIFSMEGKALETIALQATSFQYNMKALKPGMYFVELTWQNGRTQLKKIIKK